MAQQLIGIGTTANDGTGDPLRSAFDKSNDNFTELYGKPDLSLATNTLTLTKPDGTTDTVDLAPYLDDTAIVSASIDGSGIVTFVNSDTSTFTLDLSSLLDDTNLITSVDGGTGLEVDTTTGDVTVSISDGGVDTLQLADDGVTYDKMAEEFTTAAVISASDVDFSSAAVFTKTISGNTTLTFSSVETGMVKDLVITGAYTLALPASVKTITGTYDGSVGNLIQIVSTNGSTEQWATISQEA
jgi:hypothetical protein